MYTLWIFIEELAVLLGKDLGNFSVGFVINYSGSFIATFPSLLNLLEEIIVVNFGILCDPYVLMTP